MSLKHALPWALPVLALSVTATAAQEKDLRTRTDAQGETEIGFCVRPSPNSFGLPGHTFVTFSELRNAQPRKFRAIGHTISTAGARAIAFTYFGGKPVAGKQMEERFTHIKQSCLVLKVDRAIYNRAVVAARPTLTALGLSDELAASAESYRLNGHDCIDFAVQVAQILKAAGFKIPSREPTDLPDAYLRRLIDANR